MKPLHDVDTSDQQENAHQPAVAWRDVACAWALVLVLALLGVAL